MSAKNSSKGSATDWQRLKQMPDEQIDVSETPEADEAFFASAQLRYGGKPVSPAELVVIKAAPDVAAWLRNAADDELEEASAALRELMLRHRRT